jgi:hypothetical protein
MLLLFSNINTHLLIATAKFNGVVRNDHVNTIEC